MKALVFIGETLVVVTVLWLFATWMLPAHSQELSPGMYAGQVARGHKVHEKRSYCTAFKIRFPWGTCYARQCAARPNPSRIVGRACGVYVSCYRRRNGLYACYY